MNKLIIFLVNFFDHFHKKKIIKFIKNDLRIDNIELFLDIGGHHGETVDLFCKNFIIQNIISIEASPKNYEILLSKKKSFIKKFSNTKIELEKLALGNEKKIIKMKQFDESSSSTIKSINQESEYYKKKFRFLNFFKKKTFEEIDVELTKLKNFLEKKNINEVDFMKIDTEGSEYDILKGLENKISNIKLIYFEHHYDLMIQKGYKFKDINDLLVKNNFVKVFKIKMPFRKVFEYIFLNKKYNKL